ncbi:MAG: aldehyde dehydrogenase family protein [Phycisphaerales bacterium]|nr:aldehyde dehydrogenase family protein [Phycisphaerales bacterium]
MMLHIPILRHGEPYESVEKFEIVHYATGDPVALVSQANSGMLVRDIHRVNSDVLDQYTVAELITMTKKAGEIFIGGTVPVGNREQSFDDYIRDLSATTGMPITYCRNNAKKIYRMFNEIDQVVAGLTRGFDLGILDRGYGEDDGRMLSFYREANVLGAVLPSNSPGVHSLWMPAVPLKTPLVLKPGREEPWSPYRIIQSFIAAGVPKEAFGFYPTDHGGAAELLRTAKRSMLFGGEATTRPYAKDPGVELHGPGFSKVILGDDVAENWEKHLDLMVSSVLANGGRSCINASGIWTPRHGRAIADAVAKELAKVEALPADDPNAQIAAFANSKMAEMISQSIDQQLATPGAVDLTEQHRGSARLVRHGRVAYLLPTIVWCEEPVGRNSDTAHSLANKEYLFPYASVVECPTADMPDAIGPTLIGSAITSDKSLIASLMASPNVDRLNIGPIPTWQISWDQPHEGNLFEHLYRQRAFQVEPAA